MTADKHLPAALLAEFEVSQPSFVEETSIANIWKVRRADGELAAIKAYKGAHMSNEGPGFAFLEALRGEGAAIIFKRNTNCALIEWLDGPSLGDLTRAGKDKRASRELVAVANKIHSAPTRRPSNLQQLDVWFNALFSCQFGPDCPPETRKNIERCQQIARDLLANQRDICPLHGDLHHDNIKLGRRGYCAFDAKGLLGERTYELANAFRNPKGVPELVRNPERVKFLRQIWAEQFGVDPQRLMQWAIVKSALSIVWRGSGVVAADPEFDLLNVFVSVADQ